MATDYSINLKAILDTSQVQQELQKFRSQQQSLVGPNQKGTPLNNIANLANTLQGLKLSIDKLNQSIASLNSTTKVANTNQVNQKLQVMNTAANVAQLGSINRVFSSAELHRFFSPSKNNYALAGNGYALGGGNPPQKKSNKKNSSENPPTNTNKGFTPEMVRMLGGMGVGVGIDAVTQIGAYYGMSQRTQNIIQGVGAVGQYALMGSAAGPWGTAIGAIIGGAQAIAKTLTESAEIIKQSMESYRKMGTAVYSSQQGLDFDLALERKDKGYFQSRLDKENELIKNLIPSYNAIKGNLGGQTIEEYMNETALLTEKYGANVDQKTGKVRSIRGPLGDFKNWSLNPDLQRKVKELEERYFIANQYLDIVPALEKSRANRTKLQGALDSLANDKSTSNNSSSVLDNLKYILSKLVAPNLDNVNSLASQGMMINRADDTSREQSIIDYQKEQVDLQRQIRDLVKDSGTIIQ